jgi:hypothetical protein
VWEAFDPPSRIAMLGGTDGDGFGLVFRVLDIDETATPGLVQRASGTTINDVLVAALHLTVHSWNTKHDAPADRIGVQMPINIRPADRLWDVVSNLTSMVSESTEPPIERTWPRQLQWWPSRPPRCAETIVLTACTTFFEPPRKRRWWSSELCPD